VAGHVDGVGEVQQFSDGVLKVKAPKGLSRYIARKGSICVDGVSLTVNAVKGDVFDAFLIPHTRAVTTLGRLKKKSKVNLEVDLVARYVERILAAAR
jgi:riboflavin synthase